MTEHATVQAVLNRPDEAMPPPNGSSVPEHALSLTGALSTVDSTALPPIEESRVSEKFLELNNETKSDIKQPGATATKEWRKVTNSSSVSRTTVTPPPPGPKTPPSVPAPTFASPPLPPPGDLIDAATDIFEIQPAEPPVAAYRTIQQPSTPTKVQQIPVVAVPVITPRPSETRVQGTQAAWKAEAQIEADLARERDVAAAFAGLPRVKAHWTHHYMKILLVGDDGLGKTTFVRNLFAAYASDVDFPVADASGAGAGKVFGDHPEQLCTELAVQDEDAMDTPGYGDFDGPVDAEAQRNSILDYVTGCSRKHFDLEVDPSRRSSMQARINQTPDARVDVCLYFVPPHRLRRTDLRFIKELSNVVPVIPILSKADSMTPEELKEFRHAVRAGLHHHGAATWHFSKDALATAGAHHGPPFAVVAAATIDRAVGRFWPVRRYPWGRCESLLTAHSELPVLRRLLFETGYWELKAHTEKEYLRFRKSECSERSNPLPGPVRALMRLATGAALTVGAVFIAVNAAPLIRSEAVRRETVRRVKNKFGEVMEGTIETVQDVQYKAEDAARAARTAAESAVESGKRSAVKYASKLETPQVRDARIAAETRVERPWWRFWRRS